MKTNWNENYKKLRVYAWSQALERVDPHTHTQVAHQTNLRIFRVFLFDDL